MIAAFLALALLSTPEPRPVSDAERAAVGIVASYLANGPGAVWDALAADSPIRKFERDAALREIAVRLGPPREAAWELQTVVPSLAGRTAAFGLSYEAGGDDVIVFDMKKENDAWRVVSIRTLAEPQEPPRLVAGRAARPAPPPESRSKRSLALMIVFPALLVGVLGSAMTNAPASRFFLTLAAAGVITAAIPQAMPAVREPPTSVEETPPPRMPPAAHPFVSLSSLDELRKAWATGDVARFERFTSDDPVLESVARQWRAALLAGDERLDAAVESLEALAPRFVWPMAEVLRARMAYLEKREVDAAAAYERALAIGPGRDNLWLEAAETLATLGFDERAATYAARAAAIGTREAGVYYGLAVRAAVRQNDRETRDLLLTAWRLQPVERAQIIATPVLWKAVRDPVIARELKMFSAQEASFARRPEHPLDLPPAIAAEVSGDHLRLRAGGGEVDIPGGARIAPPHAVVIDAGVWRRRDEEEAIAAVAAHTTQPSAASFADPHRRKQYLEAAIALASRSRWPDVIAMTDGLSARDERVPVDLMVIRGQALARAGRTPELRPLVTDILLNPSFRRKKDPGMIRLVGELVAAMDDYDSAIALLQRANAVVPLPGVDERVVQLRIEKQLASSYASLQTAHFNILHPPEVTRESMETLGAILESEYRRLQREWFPGLDMRPVTVNVLWWEDFRAYSGSDYIAGLFTNELFLPLAGLETFEPLPVTIVTHELTHAMLAAASDNRAPRWFHEGLASHVEMREFFENAFQKYRDDRYLSVAMLDHVAERSVDPELVGEAYALGESMIRFIVERYGKSAVVAMIDAFRDGHDTDTAIERATGLSLADLDREAREWGATSPPTFDAAAFVRYDGESALPRRGMR